jgi:hypothetical protein
MDEYQEVNEISLIDLMYYCLKRWRWLTVCMIFFAIIAGVYRYQAAITENQLKKEQQSQQSAAKMGEGEVQREQIIFEDPISSAVSFAVIGMFGGMCFICLFFCMTYITGGKLQSENNFYEKFDMHLLGVIRKAESKRRWFGFIDRWICRLEEGPYSRIPRREQIKIAAVNVQAAVHRYPEKKIKRIMLAGTTTGSDTAEICEQLIEEISDVTFSPYRQIVFHAASLRKLEYYEGIVFIEKKGESYEKLIRQEKELAVSRDVMVLGTIIC